MTNEAREARLAWHLRRAQEVIDSLGITPDEMIELRRRSYGGSQVNRQPVNVAWRERIVLALKARGFSHPIIAKAVGYQSQAAIHYIVKRHKKRVAGGLTHAAP